MRVNYYQKWRTKQIEKMGGVCVQCGAVDNLEFDHIDPKTKQYNIAAIWSYRDSFVQEELSKCQLLCKTCHKEKSFTKSRHGTISAHRHYKCRCDLCRAAYNTARKRWRKSRKKITGV